MCQNWTSGGKGTAYEDLNEPNNFCRNPAPMRASRVWCYVKGEDGVKKLEFCPVPSCKDVPLSAKDLEHFLSRTKCPKNLDIQNQEEDEEGSKPKHKLPVIDLFLNPTREEELQQMYQMLEEQQGNATFTEVSIHKEITIHFSLTIYHRRLSLGSSQTCSDFSGIQCFLASPNATTRTRPTCSTSAHGRASWSTAPTSSPLLSLTLESAVPSMSRTPWWSPTTAGLCLRCKGRKRCWTCKMLSLAWKEGYRS